MNLFFFFFRSAWLRDLTHFVYARVKEKELERSDGVLLFLPREECITQFSFFFSFFVCFIFVRRENFRFCSRGLEFLCNRKKKESGKMGSKKKKAWAWDETNKFYLSLKEQILYRIIFTTDN